jgi:hypothetical protein
MHPRFFGSLTSVLLCALLLIVPTSAEEPGRLTIQFRDTPLQQALAEVCRLAGIELAIAPKEGVPEVLVNLSVRDILPEPCLRLILKQATIQKPEAWNLVVVRRDRTLHVGRWQTKGTRLEVSMVAGLGLDAVEPASDPVRLSVQKLVVSPAGAVRVQLSIRKPEGVVLRAFSLVGTEDGVIFAPHLDPINFVMDAVVPAVKLKSGRLIPLSEEGPEPLARVQRPVGPQDGTLVEVWGRCILPPGDPPVALVWEIAWYRIPERSRER